MILSHLSADRESHSASRDFPSIYFHTLKYLFTPFDSIYPSSTDSGTRMLVFSATKGVATLAVFADKLCAARIVKVAVIIGFVFCQVDFDDVFN